MSDVGTVAPVYGACKSGMGLLLLSLLMLHRLINRYTPGIHYPEMVQRATQGLEAVGVMRIRSGILTITAFTAKRDEQKMSRDCTVDSPTYMCDE